MTEKLLQLRSHVSSEETLSLDEPIEEIKPGDEKFIDVSKIKKFCYNPEDKTYCTRTCIAICITNKPYLTGMLSLLKLTPSMSFYPRSEPWTSGIIYNKTGYTMQYPNILNQPKKVTTCQLDGKLNNLINKPCVFDYTTLKSCKIPNSNKICIYFSINSLYGWVPKLNKIYIGGPTLKCEIENENITKSTIKEMSYFPKAKGEDEAVFPHKYFPFMNQKNYSRPFVSVQLDIKPYFMFYFKCRMRNILTPMKVKPVRFSIILVN